MNILVIKLIIGLLALIIFLLFIAARAAGKEELSVHKQIKTFVTGFIANFFDTFGVGSFSSIFTMRNLFGLMPDYQRYSGSLVIQATIPTAVQSVLFLTAVDVDMMTLIVACGAIAIGGIISGYISKYINRNIIINIMLITFMLSLIVVIVNKLNIINIGGDLVAVRGEKLIALAVIMFIAGWLPAFGVGYYSIVLVGIFMLGISPIVAYPIMTTASAIQMPMTAIAVIHNRKFYSSSAMLMTIAGAIAVSIAVMLIKFIDTSMLKSVLILVLLYNIYVLIKAKKLLR